MELGGGDLQVLAGRDINGGVYYVERGQGTLRAGNTIHTNPTRAALDQTTINDLAINNAVPDPTTWLPTTLFLGKGSFDIAAQGDVLLGPVANPFLLPQGINNSFFEKSYFSTYAPSDAVNVSSLTGTITLKDSADPGSEWFRRLIGELVSKCSVSLLRTPTRLLPNHNPGCDLPKPTITLTAFATVDALMPATLRVTAFSGDLNVVGSVTLSPSPTGTLDLMAAGSINGLQPNGLDSATHNYQWGASQINLSDADPNRIPGVASPLSLFYLGSAATLFRKGCVEQPGHRLSSMGFLKISMPCLMSPALTRVPSAFYKRKKRCMPPVCSMPMIQIPFIFMPWTGTFPASPCFPENQLASWPVRTSPISLCICRMLRRVT